MTQPPNPSGPPDPNAQPGYTPPVQPGYTPPPPGYTPPPPGGFPPAAPPPGYASSDEKTWALVSTFGAAAGTFVFGIFGFVGPLIAYLAKGKESPTIRAHSVAALNFFIPTSGILFILGLVINCDFFLPNVLEVLVDLLLGLAWLAVWVVGIIFGILAGIKANEGKLYKYPFTMSIIK
jgi:uncharacterized protein